METITSEKLVENFAALPPEAQKEAIHFIEFLQSRYSSAKKVRAIKGKVDDLENEPFIGIWRDRKDMQDSGEWVRTSRQQEWS